MHLVKKSCALLVSQQNNYETFSLRQQFRSSYSHA
ncbi:unnamed protein product [Amoebophrya sp. A120]|nr:unnamed protein product [Amoebophrya sp. A120]|eukprot:GSA120T00018592001.1